MASILIHISIQPLLRFIEARAAYATRSSSYFNTTLVKVHRIASNKNNSCKSISIQPLLRFIYCFQLHYKALIKISIQPLLRFIFNLSHLVIIRPSDFNTTLVKVHQIFFLVCLCSLLISIQPLLRFIYHL